MTVSISDNQVPYIGDGTTISFPYNFRVLDARHMVVSVDGVFTTDYSMTGIGEDSGGSVNFNTAPASGAEVLLYRSVPIDQLIDYVPYDPFPAETHELGLDKLTMICQQLQEQISRTIILPPGSEGGYEIVLDGQIPFGVLHFNADMTEIRADYEIGNYKGYWSSGSNYKARVTFSDPLTEDLYVVIQDHIGTDLAADETAGYIHKAMDFATTVQKLSLIHISEPTRLC